MRRTSLNRIRNHARSHPSAFGAGKLATARDDIHQTHTLTHAFAVSHVRQFLNHRGSKLTKPVTGRA